jgi:DNA-binding phage protein
MALTKEFKDTVKARAERDPAFREALFTEAVEQLLAGELDIGKAVLRDYINATVGFEKLATATGTPSKSLMRMLGPKGNPRANNLLQVIGELQRVTRVHLAASSRPQVQFSPRPRQSVAAAQEARTGKDRFVCRTTVRG